MIKTSPLSSSSSPTLLLRPKILDPTLLPRKPQILTLFPHQCRRSATFLRHSSSGVRSGVESMSSEQLGSRWIAGVGNPNFPRLVWARNLGSVDQVFLLLAFIGCTATAAAFVGFVVTAIPTLHAMGRAATALARLADTASEELPSTMSAIRLSGMEISDLTLELTDLSQEISDGITKSTQVVQAAESGIRQIGSLAHQRTVSMIQERAELPVISPKPIVLGAAKKTSQAVVHATRTFINLILRGESGSDDVE